MALLGDQLFPDPETHDFFVEELGGSLRVDVSYDAVDIQMSGRATEFERMLEILRTALVSTPITVETVTRLRSSRIKMSREMNTAPFSVADRAIAKRLFGDYPYGRPIGGTPETLARIDQADLLLAREKFHSPDNSTLVIVGGVQESRALRALRQLLGSWRKSDKRVPATFRMPDLPKTETLIVDMPGAEDVDVRLAVNSLSRSDRDYDVAKMIALLVRDRWQTGTPELNRNAFFVRNDSFLLNGMFVMGAAVPSSVGTKVLESAKATLRALIDSPPSIAELERIRTEMVAEITKSSSAPSTLADVWLDAESYRLSSDSDQLRSISKVTAADVQRVASRLFRSANFASIAVGNAANIKPEFERAGKVEVLIESTPPKSSEVKTPSTTP